MDAPEPTHSLSSRTPSTRFGLIRHAQTLWNRAGRIQGRADSPLTSQGEMQARQWAAFLRGLHWDRILASDLGRAFRTAELINRSLDLPLTTDSRLREKDWGDWSGKTFVQVREESPKLWEDMQGAGWSFRPPGGEARWEVRNRSRAALKDAYQEWPGCRILVVIHEGVIKCLVYGLLDREFLPTEPPVLKPLHLHYLIHDEGGLAVEKINARSLVSVHP
ncbi:MAG: histidine phosphatase family protein [Desulfococcaceae bacterium]